MRSPDPVVEPVEDRADDARGAPDVQDSTPDSLGWPGLAVLLGSLAAVGVWNPRVLLVILAVALIIFLHELGHFLAARHADMKVTEFFLGIGPRIWSFRRGEVEYGVKAIPVAAYVRIVGMSNLDEVPPGDEARTYRQKPYRQRMLVAVAGSGMHFLLALVLAFGVFFAIGERDAEHWFVDSASPGSAAAEAGIRAGDRVVAVDGVEVATHAAMSREVRRHPGETVDVVVERDGDRLTLPIRLGARGSLYGTIGEDVLVAEHDGAVRLNSIETESAQARAGLRDGDRLVAVNGVTLDSVDDLSAAADRSVGGRLDLVVDRDGQTFETEIDLGKDVAVGESAGFLGVGQEQPPQRLGAVEAARESASAFGETAAQSVVGIGQLFNPVNLGELANRLVQGETEPGEPDTPTSARDTSERYYASQEGRPVSIIGVVGIGSQLSAFDQFLRFLAGFNVIIGVINLIPLLPFDGGHVALGTYEKVRELLRRDGKRYFADTHKLMPVAIGVIVVMATVGLLGISLDIVSPLKL